MSALMGRLKLPDIGRAVPLLIVLMEVLWSYPWLAWASGWGFLGWVKSPINLLSALLLVFAAEILTRSLISRNWPLGRIRVTTISTLVVLILLLVRLENGGGYAIWSGAWFSYASDNLPAIIVGLAFGVFWVWRGMTAGLRTLPVANLYSGFLFGLVVLVVLLVLSGFNITSGNSRQSLSANGLFAAAYFGVGLFTLTLVNLQRAREMLHAHREIPSDYYRRWLLITAGIVGGILIISIGLASIFSFDFISILLNGLNVLITWIVTALTYIVGYPLGFIVAGLIYVVRFFINLLQGTPIEPFQAPDMSEAQNAAEGQSAWGISPAVLIALKWLIAAAVIILVIYLLARVLSRFRQQQKEDRPEEISQSLWSAAAFRNDIYSIWRWIIGRFRRRKVTEEQETPPAIVQNPVDDNREYTVREIYRGLLWASKSAGLQRRTSDTPYEFEHKLIGELSESASEVSEITEAYVQERYGGQTPDQSHTRQLNKSWQRLFLRLRNRTHQIKDPPQ